MCGINGFIQFEKNYDIEQMKNMVHVMNDKIIHRGPDKEGLFADECCSLGMRRLSIIDLDGGFQPIWDSTHSKLIVFNGELYNFLELRKELQEIGCDFQTNSDTEVVLQGYLKYGKSFLEKMDGMFAFAIYDTEEKIWTFARDRIGEKPFYYSCTNEYFVFGSELKSLLSTGVINKNIDQEALSIFLQLTYIPAPYSIIKNVKKLMPGTIMTLDSKGNINTEVYWDVKETREKYRDLDYDSAKEELRKRLIESVRKRMISDVPLGAFLSGGFDSTIIVGIMSMLSDKPINTFTIGFDDKQYDESDLANIVAKKNNTNHHVLKLDWNEVIKDIDLILENIDEPFADSSLIATYAVSKMTKGYVTVALTGDAGDELFAGYDKYLISHYSNLYNNIPSIIKKSIVEPVVKLLPFGSAISRKANKVIKAAKMSTYGQYKQMMSLGFKEPELHKLLINSDNISQLSFVESNYNYLDDDDQTKAQYSDIKVVLEGDMLAKVDRASMLVSLETRVPLLDYNVVDLAFGMDSSYKIKGKNRKIILKDAFSDLIPKEIFKAKKHGFSVPMSKWLETELKEKLLYYASEEFINDQNLFNYDYINEIIDSHMTHKEDKYSELWTFFVFQNWYDRIFYS